LRRPGAAWNIGEPREKPMQAAPSDSLVLPTLACAVRGDLVVYVSGRAMSPSDADWAVYMAYLERHLASQRRMRGLVLERGVGPTIRQRAQLEAVTKHVDARVAILTGSAFARGIVVMVAFVRPGYKAFALDALDDAFNYLGFPPPARPELTDLLRSLEAKLERGRGQPPGSTPY
jgi:hypothetical protein